MTTAAAHFIDLLETRGEAVALIAESGEAIPYAALAARADAFGAELRARGGRERGLLLIEMANTPEAVVAYAGALRARWPVILAGLAILAGVFVTVLGVTGILGRGHGRAASLSRHLRHLITHG